VVGVSESYKFIGNVIDGVLIGDRHTPSPRYVWVLSKRNDVVLGDFVKITDDARNVDFIGYISEMLPKSKYGLPLETALRSIDQERGAIDVAEFVKDPVLFLKITVLKIYNKNNGAFGDPIMPIMVGLPVYSLDDELTRRVLGMEQDPNASIHIGSLYIKQNISVYLNPLHVFNHVGIWGIQGSGKSETTTVLVEELTKLNWAVVLFDLHGEYKDINQPKKAGEQGLKVKLLTPGGNLKLEMPCLLEPDEAKELLINAVLIADEKNPLPDQGIELLKDAYDDLTQKPPVGWKGSHCPPTPDQFFKDLIERVKT
jgi:DNA helicase HerA-like ATPase